MATMIVITAHTGTAKYNQNWYNMHSKFVNSTLGPHKMPQSQTATACTKGVVVIFKLKCTFDCTLFRMILMSSAINTEH